jgi:hypothetical protein
MHTTCVIHGVHTLHSCRGHDKVAFHLRTQFKHGRAAYDYVCSFVYLYMQTCRDIDQLHNVSLLIFCHEYTKYYAATLSDQNLG